MLRDILLNHARGMFNHSELGLLEQSLSALPRSNLLENPRLILLQARLMQSQHRYSEVNTLLARAEQEMSVEMDTAMHGDFNALRAQVAINDGDRDEAERLSMVALEELPLANYYSRIVATSVHGEVLHCKETDQISRRDAADRTDGPPSRRLALRPVEHHSAKRNSVRPGFLQAARRAEKAFQLVREQHLEQLPMHEFLLRIRSQLLWAWARLDEAEACARRGWRFSQPINRSSSCSARR